MAHGIVKSGVSMNAEKAHRAPNIVPGVSGINYRQIEHEGFVVFDKTLCARDRSIVKNPSALASHPAADVKDPIGQGCHGQLDHQRVAGHLCGRRRGAVR